MPTPTTTFTFNTLQVQLCVPNKQLLYNSYHQQTQYHLFATNNYTNFPYWAKVWHSAIALSKFIAANPTLFHQKNVLELAAGLGLPSIVAAQYAKQVLCTDYVSEALQYIQQSVTINGLTNCTTAVLNWNSINGTIPTDILLMSDVNYDSTQFDMLYKIFQQFLAEGSTILLATPQRLMAKPFVEKLLPFCVNNVEYEIDYDDEISFVNVLVLQGK